MLTKWLRKKLGITQLEEENRHLKNLISSHRQFVTSQMAELRDFTRVDADIGVRGNNTIVLSGVYRRKAFVRFYDVGSGEFEALVRQMGEMKRHALVRNVDRPPELRGSFEF